MNWILYRSVGLAEICFDIAFGVSRILKLKVVTEDVKLTSALSGDSIGLLKVVFLTF